MLAVPLMTPLALYSESSEASMAPALQSAAFWRAMVGAALLGFLISIATFMQINYTSALTNNISGTVKVCDSFFVLSFLRLLCVFCNIFKKLKLYFCTI